MRIKDIVQSHVFELEVSFKIYQDRKNKLTSTKMVHWQKKVPIKTMKV